MTKFSFSLCILCVTLAYFAVICSETTSRATSAEAATASATKAASSATPSAAGRTSSSPASETASTPAAARRRASFVIFESDIENKQYNGHKHNIRKE